LHLNITFLHDITMRQPNAVGPGRNGIALYGIVIACRTEQKSVIDGGRRIAAQVPGKAIDSFLRRNGDAGIVAAALDTLLFVRFERTNDNAAAIQNFELQFLFFKVGIVCKGVINDSAIWRTRREALTTTIASRCRRQPLGCGWIIKMCDGGFVFSFILTERRNVIDHPECSSLRCEHQIIATHHQVGDRDDRQVGLQCLPVLAAVE